MSDDHNSFVADNYCPSQGWDDYCAGQEIPETCPICGEENADEDGNPICKTDPAFCCKEHAEQYAAEQKKQDEAAAAEYFAEVKAIQEHNAKCPCRKGSTKYCFCPTNPDNQEG